MSKDILEDRIEQIKKQIMLASEIAEDIGHGFDIEIDNNMFGGSITFYPTWQSSSWSSSSENC